MSVPNRRRIVDSPMLRTLLEIELRDVNKELEARNAEVDVAERHRLELIRDAQRKWSLSLIGPHVGLTPAGVAFLSPQNERDLRAPEGDRSMDHLMEEKILGMILYEAGRELSAKKAAVVGSRWARSDVIRRAKLAGWTLADISNIIDVTDQRVSQIDRKARSEEDADT